MTFAIPEDIARKFVGRVPARKRSKYLTEALEHKLSRQDEDLVQACKQANADADSAALEKEMESIEDGIEEPWEAPFAVISGGSPSIRRWALTFRKPAPAWCYPPTP